MTPIQKTGEFLFRYRDYTPIPIIILAILFAEPSVLSLALGIGVACLGEFVRTYGVAYIGTISRTRANADMHSRSELATDRSLRRRASLSHARVRMNTRRARLSIVRASGNSTVEACTTGGLTKP